MFVFYVIILKRLRQLKLSMYTFVRWNYVFIAPPLTISKEHIDEGLDIISESLKLLMPIHLINEIILPLQ
jgi:4-aminobutyrate aminotransferase-like enzyme